MMSPTNYLGTNPEALARAVETEGQSLVDGLENLVRDIEANSGDLIVTLADKDAFKVGGNLATTPGKVVFRNRMMELIQYAPATDEVYETPLVIFPPWINKFYILDLKPQNSLIKWMVDQGFTLFVVVLGQPRHRLCRHRHGRLRVRGLPTRRSAVAREICGQDQVNAVGYCIAGTTLSMTLARLEADDQDPVQFGDAFHHAHRFLGPGRGGGVPRRRLRRRDRARGDRQGGPRLLLHVRGRSATCGRTT